MSLSSILHIYVECGLWNILSNKSSYKNSEWELDVSFFSFNRYFIFLNGLFKFKYIVYTEIIKVILYVYMKKIYELYNYVFLLF